MLINYIFYSSWSGTLYTSIILNISSNKVILFCLFWGTLGKLYVVNDSFFQVNSFSILQLIHTFVLKVFMFCFRVKNVKTNLQSWKPKEAPKMRECWNWAVLFWRRAFNIRDVFQLCRIYPFLVKFCSRFQWPARRS